MRKLLILTALAVVLGAPAAMAEKGAEDDGHHSGHGKGKMFEKADINADGAISKEEFRDFHGKVFDKMDIDGNGQITQEEQQKRRTEWKEKMQMHRSEGHRGMHQDDAAPPVDDSASE